MKFCRHDWHVHKKLGNTSSFRYFLFREDKGLAVSAPIIGFAYGASTACILNSLGIIGVGMTVFLFILITFFVMAFVIFDGLEINVGEDSWRKVDKSCIKCSIIKFDATNAETKAAKAKVIQDKKDSIKLHATYHLLEKRTVQCKEADSRYTKLMDLRKLNRT